MSGSEVGWGLKAIQKLFVRYFITRRDGSEAQERIGASFGAQKLFVGICVVVQSFSLCV